MDDIIDSEYGNEKDSVSSLEEGFGKKTMNFNPRDDFGDLSGLIKNNR